MGKIDISEDLRNKLNKVLSYKSTDIGNIPVGPAQSWKPTLHQPPHPPQPPHPHQPPQPHQPHQPPQYYVKHDKNKKKKDKIKYYKITKVVFLSSVVAAIGVTLGLKIANFLFF